MRERVRIVLDRKQGVERDRDHARMQAAEEGDRPVGAVVHQQQHALLAPHAERRQPGGAAPHRVGEFTIGQAARIVDVGGLRRSIRVARDQMAGEIEALGGRSDFLAHAFALVKSMAPPGSR